MMSISNSSGRFELVADGFSFPTSLTFDESGIAYVAESGLPFGGHLQAVVSGGLTLMAIARF